jgi:hypothetical protein
VCLREAFSESPAAWRRKDPIEVRAAAAPPRPPAARPPPAASADADAAPPRRAPRQFEPFRHGPTGARAEVCVHAGALVGRRARLHMLRIGARRTRAACT